MAPSALLRPPPPHCGTGGLRGGSTAHSWAAPLRRPRLTPVGGRGGLATERGGRALEMLFVKSLLQNDPEELVVFSVTQFSLP